MFRVTDRIRVQRSKKPTSPGTLVMPRVFQGEYATSPTLPHQNLSHLGHTLKWRTSASAPRFHENYVRVMDRVGV